MYACQKKITEEGKPFPKESLQLKWSGKEERNHSLVDTNCENDK